MVQGMMIWALKIIGWVLGNPWGGAAVAAVISLLIGWHVLTERSARLAQVEQAIQTERMAWEREYAAEARRQQKVNAEALAAAQKEVARLEAENVALAANQKEWDREADAAPDAGEWCLTPDSLMRLNRSR